MIMKKMTLMLVVCLLYVAVQAFPVSAMNLHAPGTVTTWGDGSSRIVPVVFPVGVTPISFSAYEYHGGLAITQDGSLYDWFGVSNVVPARVTFPPAVTEVIAASKRYAHTLALTNDGLYAWGLNYRGQLGDGTVIDRSTPTKVVFPPEVTSVTAVAAGYIHSLAITNDGLYAWGQSWTGQLGNGSFGKLPDGSIERGQTLPVKVLFDRKVTSVTDIEAGEYYAMAITNDGLYAWGMNQSGSLGTGGGTTALPMKVRFPKAVTTVQEIAASTNHSLAVTNDGLYVWGNNSAGQLGIDKYYVFTPVKVPGEDDAIDVGAIEYSSIAIH